MNRHQSASLQIVANVSFSLVACLSCVGHALASPTISAIGPLPGHTGSFGDGVSNNGIASASSRDNTNPHAVRWTSGGGSQDLGTLGGTESYGADISTDGSVLVGFSGTGMGYRAYRWTGGVMQNLGVLAGGNSSYARGVSGDGSVVVGLADNATGSRAFRWTSGGGMQEIGLAPGQNTAGANAISRDGSTIVGSSQLFSDNERPFRWTSGGGAQNLPLLNGATSGNATGVSADGSVVVGWGIMGGNSNVNRAFRWTENSGVQDIGALPGYTSIIANGVSGDGTIIVGGASNGGELLRAFLATPSLGVVDLNTYLPTLGVDLTGWTLRSATDISADGSAITGFGDFNGRPLGFVITNVPAPTSAGLLALAGLLATRRRRHTHS